MNNPAHEQAVMPAAAMGVDPSSHVGNKRRRIIATGLMLSALGIAACGNSDSLGAPTGSTEPTSTTVLLNPEQAKTADALCGPEGIDFEAHLSNLSNVGDPKAFYPKFAHPDQKGNEVLISTEAARSEIMKTICGSSSALAVFTAVFAEPHGANKSPDQTSINRIATLDETFRASKPDALDAIEKAHALLKFLTPTDRFVTTTNQATLVKATRNSDGSVKGFATEKLGVGKSQVAFVLGFDRAAPDLDTQQIGALTKLQNNVGFTANGEVIIDNWLGNLGASFTPETSSTTIPASANSSSQAQGGSASNNGGGQFGSSNGKGESNQPGNVPENGGNGGFTPGSAPSFGPGHGSETTVGSTSTPNTVTVTTSPNRNTTTTISRGVTTTTVQQVTTTTGNKGTVPVCVPKPPYIICP